MFDGELGWLWAQELESSWRAEATDGRLPVAYPDRPQPRAAGEVASGLVRGADRRTASPIPTNVASGCLA